MSVTSINKHTCMHRMPDAADWFRYTRLASLLTALRRQQVRESKHLGRKCGRKARRAWTARGRGHLGSPSDAFNLRALIDAGQRRGRLTLSSKVSSVRAAFRIFERAICTRQSSRLFRSPYSPTAFSSASSRSFSYGRRGFLNVLPSAQHGDGQAPGSPPWSRGAGHPGAAARGEAASSFG